MSAYEDDPYDSRRHRAPPPSSYRSKPSRVPRDKDRYDADDSDEDDAAATGFFGKVNEAINTARDIGHVIWTVGWGR